MMCHRSSKEGAWLPILVIAVAIVNLRAQMPLKIYTDKTVNGFHDSGFASRNLSNASPVHSGSFSISVTATTNQALSFGQNGIDSSPYGNFIFWANGGSAGGQLLQVYATIGDTDQPPYSALAALSPGKWEQFTVPLSALNAANNRDLSKISVQLRGGSSGTFYLDDIQLNAKPAPPLVHLHVDANEVIRRADPRWFGINVATWDSGLCVTSTLPALNEMGITTLRWPGGSTSDEYHWASDPIHNGNFRNIVTNLHANAIITVNYGSGSSTEAAEWVQSANVTYRCGFKYWEIGNECYGSWETDKNVPPHDPYTYAIRAAGYLKLMKHVDPGIKIGVVAVPGEDSFANYTSHPARNRRTGLVHNGWTPVMLATLKNLGVVPDFLVYHFYPENTPTGSPQPANDSDALLLQAARNWSSDATDLRQQVVDYLGATASSNIELLCTENNSDSGAQGRQSTSIVNALYLADSISQLMKTEFNSFVWWDLRNGRDASGCFDPSIYGWRTCGDLGLLGRSSRYPTFYTEKLLHCFITGQSTILNAHSDYLLLSAYAARNPGGSLALLVINKDLATSFSAQISLDDFIPSPTAVVRFYGIAQDEAVRTNNPAPGAQDISTNGAAVGASFTNTFPAGSITLFTFTPLQSAPGLHPLPTLSGRSFHRESGNEH
jgi:hypothetical protein